MKRNTLFYFAFCLAFLSCGINKKVKFIKDLKECTVAPTNYKQSFPMEINCGDLMVKVKIRDKYYNFLYDTEAVTCILDSALVKELGLTSNLETKNKQTNKISTFSTLQELDIEQVKFKNIVSWVMDLSSYNKCTCKEIQGVLGNNLFSKSIWQLDYPDKKMVLASHRDSLQFAKDKKVIPFSNPYSEGIGAPTVQLRIGYDYFYDARISTKTNFSLGLPRTAFKRVADSSAILTQYALDGTRQRVNEATKIKGLTISNSLPLDSFWVYATDRRHAYLGSSLFKHYVMTLDWQKREVIFSSRQNLTFSETSLGLYFYFSQNKVRITVVEKGSPAEAAGLRPGDEIIARNEESFEGFSYDDYCEWSKKHEKDYPTKAKFTIKRGEMIKTVELEAVRYETLFKK